MNYSFLDIISDVVSESIIHLPARSKIDPYAIKRQTMSFFSEVTVTFAV